MLIYWERISNVYMYFLFIFCKILDVFFFDGCFNIESKVEIGFLYKEY